MLAHFLLIGALAAAAPPPEAVSACAGASEGQSCSFPGHSGSCLYYGSNLACAPQGAPRPPKHGVPPMLLQPPAQPVQLPPPPAQPPVEQIYQEAQTLPAPKPVAQPVRPPVTVRQKKPQKPPPQSDEK